MNDLPDTTSWAVRECADADLGDLRRTQRVDDRLQSHLEAPSSRRNAVPLVVAVHETTEAHWTHVRATAG